MALSDAAIVAYAEVKTVERSERDLWEIAAEILENLLDRAGLEKGAVDGLLLSSSATGASNCFWAQTTADYLGLELNFAQTVDIGGCSPVACVARAAAALDAGLCETVLLLFADTPVAEANLRFRNHTREWTIPQGIIGPPGDFGLLSTRYEHQFGLDHASLGKLAVAQRNHAILNDLACEKLRKPITVEDYLQSRMIADPLRLLDCVMSCDGGSGLLMMSRSRAEQLGLHRKVIPTGYGERTNHRIAEPLADVTESGHLPAGQRAFAQAGITAKDVRSLHPYDDFLIAILIQLEMLGFCARGQGSAFIAEHDFDVGGDLPLNTSGGQISAGQVGLAGGGTNLVEAVRQLFGEAGARQVGDTSNAVVTGIGNLPYARNWSTSSVLVLVPEA